MKPKNKILKILIIAVVVLIIVLLGVISFLFFKTDIFKSNKQNFFKYTIQMANDLENGLIDSKTKAYYEKKQNTPYKNKGNISFKYDSQKYEQAYKNINNLTISFSGMVDNANSKKEQEISINYSNNVKFPINFKKVGNIIGLQTKFIGEKVIAYDTKQDSNKIMDNEESIGKFTEVVGKLQEGKLTNQEKEHLKDAISKVFNEQLGKEKFTQMEEKKGYQLKVTKAELNNLTTKIKETLEEDEVISKRLSEDEYFSNILESILDSGTTNAEQEISQSGTSSNEEITISVYVSKGTTNKIEIYNQKSKVTLQKTVGNDESQYQLLLEYKENDNLFKLELSARYTGLENMQNVKGSYGLSFAMSETEVFNYALNTEVEFTNSTNIEEFTEENSVILTDSKYSKESVSNFLNVVREKIKETNRNQMEELGLEEDENPLKHAVPISQIIEPLTGNSIKQISEDDSMKQATISSFNEQYEKYESNKASAQSVRGVMSEIQKDEEQKSTYKIKELNLNGEEFKLNEVSISEMKEKIELEKKYRIEFEKESETGVIYRAVINEVASE